MGAGLSVMVDLPIQTFSKNSCNTSSSVVLILQMKKPRKLKVSDTQMAVKTFRIPKSLLVDLRQWLEWHNRGMGKLGTEREVLESDVIRIALQKFVNNQEPFEELE